MSLQKHVVFMNLAATGHMNPTLPLVKRFKDEGCIVSYFVDEKMRSVVEAAGAAWYPYRYPNSDFTGLLDSLDAHGQGGVAKYVPENTPKEEYGQPQFALIYASERLLPGLLEDLQSMEVPPSVIVYDPFLPAAQVAAHVLRVPAVGTMTMPGPGVLDVPDDVKEAWDMKPWVDGPRQHMLATYGFDVLKQGSLMEFYSPTLNLVTTVNELYAPPKAGRQSRIFGGLPFKCVGTLADTKVKRIANANVKQDEPSDALPMHDIDEMLSAGKRLLYISMGTVATGDNFWSRPFGAFGASNGLADCTGKQLTQHVFRSCFEAVGGDDDFLVVMSLGPQSDSLEGLPPVPANFIVRQSVPQLEVLQRCAAFLTHGGANSMHEALSLGIPMAVVPIFGDQPDNADSVARCGAGVGFRQPLTTATAGSLRAAFQQLTASESSFRAEAQTMAQKIKAAGGVPAAVGSILEVVQSRGAPRGGA